MIMTLSEPFYLARYFLATRDKLPSQYLISRSVNVDFSKDSPIDDLWKLHNDAMKTFRERKELIRSLKEVQGLPVSSLLDLKSAIAGKMLENCEFCERRCGINRKKKEIGYCRCDAISRYSSEFLHHGEEPELVPSHTIFFSGCNFSCVYCQNWQISTNPRDGISILPEELARTIALRRAYGSRNVNFVTPTPHTHTILKILQSLRVNVPVVWNSNMYYSDEAARLLEGVVDVYLGDFRYGNDECAMRYSNVPDYLSVVARNFMRAYESGEILLRQLVIPNHIECCTRQVIEWTKEHIPKVRFNLMFQYSPNHMAYKFPEINRKLTGEECQKALDILKKSGPEDVLL